MRKLATLALCCLLALCLAACGGNTRGVRIGKTGSEIYSQADIDAAVRVILREFAANWQGCTLRTIDYAGDESLAGAADTAARYGAEEVIVLTSTFDVDDSGGNGSLNPDSTYEGWTWTLVRAKGGAWRHVDHGYG